MVVQIRLSKESDLIAVHQLAVEYTSFDASPTFADIEGLYQRNPEYFYVAIDESEKIVGFITGYERKSIPEEVLLNWNASKVGYIELMAVKTGHRQKGIGTMLLNKLLERFQAGGIDLVILDVPMDQQPALKLYEKLGFKVRAYNLRKHLRSRSGAGSGI